MKADQNEVSDFDAVATADLPWCQRLDLSENKLTVLPSFQALGRLRFAMVVGNEIASVQDFGGHPTLEELDLRRNQLQSLTGLGSFPKLRSLTLAENQLLSLVGLDAPALVSLNLESNKLESLEGLSGAPALKELDIKGNTLSAPAEDEGGPAVGPAPELLRLGSEGGALEGIMVAGTPLFDGFGDGLKTELLIVAPWLLRVEGEGLTEEDRQAARDAEEQREDERRAREEAEAAAAAAAAEEAKAAAEAEAAAAAEAEAAPAEEA